MKKERTYDANWLRKLKEGYLNGEISKSKALNFIVEYINKYPSDEHAKTFYITLLINNHMINEAEQYLENVFDLNYNRSLQLYLIAIFKGDYKTAYELFPKAYDLINETGGDSTSFFLEKIFLENNLGLYQEKNQQLCYMEKQITSYSKQRAIEHIELHKKEDKTKEVHNLFEEEIDVEKLFDQVSEIIKNSELYIVTEISNIYIFNYPDVQDKIQIDGMNYKYLKVVTVRDTKNIVTMYPIFTNTKIRNINYFETELENTKVKTKQLSQIDKFNKRYGRG